MENLAFHHSATVQGVRIRRLLIAVPIALVMIWFGTMLVPVNELFRTYVTGILNGAKVLLGHFLVLAGIWALISESIRILLAGKNAGSWTIELTSDALTWEAPKHPFGRETSFKLALSDIDHSELRTHSDDGPAWSYWLHPKTGRAIRLSDASGVQLNQLFDALAKLGVPHRDTQI